MGGAAGLLVVLLAGGCPSAGVNVPAPPSEQTVSFSKQIQPIFDAHCTTCHRVGGLADLEGIALKLTADRSFDLLVNQPSTQQPDLTLVLPGDADASLLFQKVASASPPVGARMPLVGPPLSSDNLGLIRDWINQGAMNN